MALREAAAKYLDRLKFEGGKVLKMKRQRIGLHLGRPDLVQSHRVACLALLHAGRCEQ